MIEAAVSNLRGHSSLDGIETVASIAQSIDGLPFKTGCRSYKVKQVQGVDDFRSIHEVAARRFSQAKRLARGLPRSSTHRCFL